MAKKYGYYAQDFALISMTGFFLSFAPSTRWQTIPDDSTIRRQGLEQCSCVGIASGLCIDLADSRLLVIALGIE